MPYMYILECADGTYYTGSTVNLERRLWEHENGIGANYTRKKKPVRLVYFAEFARIDDAYHREKQVQGWSHAKKKALIECNWERVKELAQCMNESHWRNAGFDSAQPTATIERSLSEVEKSRAEQLLSHTNRPLSAVETSAVETARNPLPHHSIPEVNR